MCCHHTFTECNSNSYRSEELSKLNHSIYAISFIEAISRDFQVHHYPTATLPHFIISLHHLSWSLCHTIVNHRHIAQATQKTHLVLMLHINYDSSFEPRNLNALIVLINATNRYGRRIPHHRNSWHHIMHMSTFTTMCVHEYILKFRFQTAIWYKMNI